MANFWVTGVWKNANGIITHIFTHSVTDTGGYHRGVKRTLADGIKMIDIERHTLTTRRWAYPGWKTGAQVIVVTENGGKYLRTKPDAQTIDNLDNMLPMSLAID